MRKTVSAQDFSSCDCWRRRRCASSGDGVTGIPFCPRVRPGSRRIEGGGLGGAAVGSGGGILRRGRWRRGVVVRKLLLSRGRRPVDLRWPNARWVEGQAAHRRHSVNLLAVMSIRLRYHRFHWRLVTIKALPTSLGQPSNNLFSHPLPHFFFYFFDERFDRHPEYDYITTTP